MPVLGLADLWRCWMVRRSRLGWSVLRNRSGRIWALGRRSLLKEGGGWRLSVCWDLKAGLLPSRHGIVPGWLVLKGWCDGCRLWLWLGIWS